MAGIVSMAWTSEDDHEGVNWANTIDAWGHLQEKEYVLTYNYFSLPDFRAVGKDAAIQATRDALHSCQPRLHRAYLRIGVLEGELDLLRWIPASSTQPAGYEVGDVKSSTRPKPEQIMQVLFYSALLAEVQGHLPSYGFLILGDGQEWRFSLDDYWAYFEALMHQALDVVNGSVQTAPVWQDACQNCRWQSQCLPILQAEDHLSLIPGLRSIELARLQTAGIMTRREVLATDGVEGIGDRRLSVIKHQVRADQQGVIQELLPWRSPLLPTIHSPYAVLNLQWDFRHPNDIIGVAAQIGLEGAVSFQLFDKPSDHDFRAWLEGHLGGVCEWFVWEESEAQQLRRLPLRSTPRIWTVRDVAAETWTFPGGVSDVQEAARQFGYAPADVPEAAYLAYLQRHLFSAERQGDLMRDLSHALTQNLEALHHVLRACIQAQTTLRPHQ